MIEAFFQSKVAKHRDNIGIGYTILLGAAVVNNTFLGAAS